MRDPRQESREITCSCQASASKASPKVWKIDSAGGICTTLRARDGPQNGGIYTEAREQLLQTLPKSVDPMIFPPITVSPDQLVTHLTQMNVNGEDRSTLRSHIRTMRVSA